MKKQWKDSTLGKEILKEVIIDLIIGFDHMRTEFTRQYQKCIDIISENKKEGKLISLMSIYNDYKRPRYLSPRRVIRYRQLRELIKYLIIKSDYRVEEVIRFSKGEVYGNADVALEYLNLIDVKNYVRALLLLKQDNSPGSILNTFFKPEDDSFYADLPF